MQRYLRLFSKFIKLSWMQAMEYRTNFLLWMGIDVCWCFVDLIFTLVLIDFTQSMGHWGKGEILIVLGLFRLMVVVVWGWLFPSFSLVPKFVSEGQLDLILTKPVDSQFMASSRAFSFSILPSFVTGIGFIVAGFFVLGRAPSIAAFVASLWLVGVSTALIYGIYFLTVAWTLYVDRLSNIQHVFLSIYDSARYPADIFLPSLRRIFTTIIPMALIISVPAQALFEPFSWGDVVYFHFLAITFLLLGRLVWQNGLKRYSSASS